MITFKVTGTEKIGQLANKIKVEKVAIPSRIEEVLQRFALRAIRSSKQDYLSGPRPEKLGVVTGLLRSSIRAAVGHDSKSAFMTLGTWVPYARIHEEGGDIPTRRGRSNFGTSKHPSSKISAKGFAHYRARPFLRPAIEDNLPALRNDLKTVLNRIGNVK